MTLFTLLDRSERQATRRRSWRGGNEAADVRRRRVAVHLAGHAICAAAVGLDEPAGTVSLATNTGCQPGSSEAPAHRAELLDHMVGVLGGRAAEEHVYGSPSPLSDDDLRRATALARDLVRESLAGSPGTVAERDGEVQATIVQALARARDSVAANEVLLSELTAWLVAEETVEGPGLERLLGRVRPARPTVARRPLVPEQLASFRDIGNWLSPGFAGGL